MASKPKVKEVVKKTVVEEVVKPVAAHGPKADCPLCGGKGVYKEDEQSVCPCANS